MGVLKPSWAVWGGSLGHFWALLGGLGRLRGVAWGTLGRSKIDQKRDPKLDPKTGRIATEKNGPNATPVVVSELDTGRRDSDPIRLEIYRYRF